MLFRTNSLLCLSFLFGCYGAILFYGFDSQVDRVICLMLETPVFEGHSNRVSREEIKDPTKNCIALCMQKENRSVSTYENRSVSASHQSSRGEGIFSPSLVTINYYARNFAWHRSSNVSVCISMLGVTFLLWYTANRSITNNNSNMMNIDIPNDDTLQLSPKA